ncbi:hypothetical protein [Frigoribacterium sp. VKM Ac-2530]|uniref:hypothetical protein n=1 Tax=Frigoribacterium sp. VKM Ac-2530 TaxID=2783822 RepID=UPI00188CBCE1|nr:hypothetical protein [Frigoribacterium sp. VKM Ac-2530]MBF4580497.1 hypothetical protein [Frigoribacterium sp. VKM Ac-2530]
MTFVSNSVRGVAAALRGLFTVVGAALAGAAVMVVVLLGAVAVTLTTGTAVHLPGVLQTWPGTENGAPAVLFEPDGVGTGAAVLLVALVLVLASSLWSRRSRARTSASARAGASST